MLNVLHTGLLERRGRNSLESIEGKVLQKEHLQLLDEGQIARP
jgi:hypothetical protein